MKMKKRLAMNNPIPAIPVRRLVFPFVHRIESSDAERTYTFAPTKQTQFQIAVVFPLADADEIKVRVIGDVLNRELAKAMEFVERNEAEFSEAFYCSLGDSYAPKPPRKIGETEFQKL